MPMPGKNLKTKALPTFSGINYNDVKFLQGSHNLHCIILTGIWLYRSGNNLYKLVHDGNDLLPFGKVIYRYRV